MTTATKRRGRPPKAELQLPPSDRTDAEERDPGRIDQPDGNGRETQGYLDPDMAPPAIQEIDDAAEEYRRVRDRRMELTKEESRRNEQVVELMRKHGLTEYTFDGSEVSIKNKTKARVRRIKEDDGDEDYPIHKRSSPARLPTRLSDAAKARRMNPNDRLTSWPASL